MSAADLVTTTPVGLACTDGGFHIDPWGAAPVAVVTHAHGDHLRPGSGRYLVAAPGAALARRRLPPGATLEAVPYGQPLRLGATTVSLHPSGHVLGAAQVRIAHDDGRTWVVTGDWKRERDPTCAPLEVVPCDVLVTEATFALPIHRWPEAEAVAEEVLAWWDACATRGRCAVLFCYALGKAQRLLALLASLTDRRVWLHGAMAGLVDDYRAAGSVLLPTALVRDAPRGTSFRGELVLAPPSAHRSPWLRRLGELETGLASGWMRIRGVRRRRAFDRGFVLSDHADWPALTWLPGACGARRLLATHGHADVLARWAREAGLEADVLATEFEGEGDVYTGALEPPDTPEAPA